MGSRWQFLKESQYRKGTGITLGVLVLVFMLVTGYDLAVSQLADDPNKWLRIRDILQLFPWYIWVLLVLALFIGFFFEGGYRAVDRRDAVIQGLEGQQRQLAVVAGSPGQGTHPIGPSMTVPILWGTVIFGPIGVTQGLLTGKLRAVMDSVPVADTVISLLVDDEEIASLAISGTGFTEQSIESYYVPKTDVLFLRVRYTDGEGREYYMSDRTPIPIR